MLALVGARSSPCRTCSTDFWLGVLVRVGIFAIGAIGLNLLTGYTGQVSLGHAFFLAVGAYTWAHFGGEHGLVDAASGCRWPR